MMQEKVDYLVTSGRIPRAWVSRGAVRFSLAITADGYALELTPPTLTQEALDDVLCEFDVDGYEDAVPSFHLTLLLDGEPVRYWPAMPFESICAEVEAMGRPDYEWCPAVSGSSETAG